MTNRFKAWEWIGEKGNCSVVNKNKWRGAREASTSLPQFQLDTNPLSSAVVQESPTVSPFVTLGLLSMKTATPLHSLNLPPFSKLSSTLTVVTLALCPVLVITPFCSFSGLHFFLHYVLWLHTSDPLNRFISPILKVCLLSMVSQTLFVLLSTPESDLPNLFSLSSLFSAPFLDNYSTAISLWRWKSILPPVTVSPCLRIKGRQLAGPYLRLSIHLPLRSDDKAALNQCSTDVTVTGERWSMRQRIRLRAAEEQTVAHNWFDLLNTRYKARAVISF